MTFGDQCKVKLCKGRVAGMYLKDGCDSTSQLEWTHVEIAAVTFAAATILKGMQKHQEISTPSNVRCGLLQLHIDENCVQSTFAFLLCSSAFWNLCSASF